MRGVRWCVPVVVLTVCIEIGFANPIQSKPIPKDTSISFNADVYPALKRNCVACHNANKSEADVNLETYEAIFNSEYGELVSPGAPDDSRLYSLAAHADEPVMPPANNNVAAANFTPLELGFLREWIVRGAKNDPKPTTSDSIAWQSLSNAASPTYATAITGDARLIAASSGNRVHVFGKNDPNAIAELVLANGQPAHRDLVQDVTISEDGHTIISAGYRNVKIWSLVTPQVETIDLDDAEDIALSTDGTHVAALRKNGQISVVPLGAGDAAWSKPTEIAAEQFDSITGLAVSNDGSLVAFAVGVEVRAIQKNTKSLTPTQLPAIVTDIGVDGENRLVVGDQTGTLTTLTFVDDVWHPTSEKLFETTVEFLEISRNGKSTFVADAVGNIAWRPGNADAFTVKAELPTGAANATIAHDDSAVWVGLTNRGLVRIDSARKENAKPEFEDVYQNDPVLEDQRARAQWQTVVAQQLIGANEADLKRTETNHTGEKTNQEKLNANIEKRKKAVPEATKALEAAEATFKSAQEKLEDATTARDTAKAEREELESAIAELATRIAELKETPDDADALDTATKSKLDKEAALKKTPALKPLEDAVVAATKAIDAGTAIVETMKKSQKDAEAALKLAHETKARSDAQLTKLSAEIERWKQTVEKSKTSLEEKKKRLTDIQSERNASRPYQDAVVSLPSGGFLSQGTSGAWSIWSTAGDWIAEVPQLPADGEVAASAAGVVLIRSDSAELTAYQLDRPSWKLQRTLGSTTGESPFADRVLCLDIDPAETLLATGGGVPARHGDVHLWNVDDGSLVTSIESAHTDTVLAIRFSPDGKKIATASADRLIKLWDVATGQSVGVLEGHTHHVTTLDWNVSQRQIASASADFDIRSWDLNTMKTSRKISLFKSEVTNLTYAGQNNRVAAVGGDQTFRIIATDNGRQEVTTGISNGYGFAVSANRGGDLFVVGGADGQPRLVDNKGKVLQTFVTE